MTCNHTKDECQYRSQCFIDTHLKQVCFWHANSNVSKRNSETDLPEEKKQEDNNLDYVAYLLYQLDAKEAGYHAWRWLCLNEYVREKFRSKAKQKVDDWIYEEDFMKEKRKQF